MRALLLFVIGLTFGAAGGFLAAGGLPTAGHDHAGHSDAAHDHSALRAWGGPPPTLELVPVRDDGTDDVTLHIQTTGFGFAPELVNGPSQPGVGHAHVFVNGEKVLRAYGAWVQVPDVPQGATLRVTLTANDHVGWAVGGEPVAAEVTIP